MKKESEIQKSIPREILEWVLCIVVAFVLAIIIKYFIFTPTLVKQTSMYPTIFDGDRVWVNRLARTFHSTYERGDIVTLEEPNGGQLSKQQIEDGEVRAQYVEHTGLQWFTYNMLEWGKTSFIKRVIGLPGDHVFIEDGKVYINDELLDESDYLPDWTETPHFYGRNGIKNDFVVPEGYIFAMGDNRGGSMDCRLFGCVPIEKIEGKVVGRIWPLDRFGGIEKSTMTEEEFNKNLKEMNRTEI